MFELSLSKLALIGLVALVVVGPEKLPKVARMAGSLLGRAQRYFNDIKAEMGREAALDELRRLGQNVHAAASSIQDQLTSLRPVSHIEADNPKNTFKAATFNRRKQARASAVAGKSRRRIALSSSASQATRRSGSRPPSFFG